MNKTQLAFIVALSVVSTPALAAEINVGGGTIKIDEGGVTIGEGVIEVTPDGIKVPGVVVKPSGESTTAAQPQGGSAPGQVFTGTDFSGANHSGRDYSGGRFIGVDFSDANLTNANFTGAEFQGVDFADANLTGAIFTNARFQGDDFADANLTRANFTEAHFQGVDFSDSNLQDACFMRANLIANDFRDAMLNGAVFTDVSRIGNDFGNTDLSGIVWKGSGACPKKTAAIEQPSITTAATITQELAKGKDAKVDLRVNFEFDSDKIQAQGHAQVLEIANALKSVDLAKQRVMIEGHTDNVGNDAYNLDLSYRRAITVMRTLSEQYGIESGRLQVKGFGETQPVASNEIDEGRALNRRVTLVNLGEN